MALHPPRSTLHALHVKEKDMPVAGSYTLTKEERICSKLLIDKLFGGGGSHSMSAFPLRLVYMPVERGAEEPAAKMLVSVPKRYFKRAVKRNRVKRQVREAYRKNKHLLAFEAPKGVAMAFIWLDNRLYDTAVVERRVNGLLVRLSERL